ncbi:hypothetical protein EKH79_09870 [Dyella dinghuensis]|uniref:Uncharacterized protein n=1 Tax=Dyella dinghuensis TaxID=1920169 RepID=A0A432LUR9_9GAMM|nr:hypothetical protein [Dyella dinghuensis]RUL64334.1 hypothetical protein EKH79_09870 [Dyella dinghuensis]
MIAWVLLLAAGFGCVQYVRHVQQLWGVLQTLPAGDSDIDQVHAMLAWDAGYFAVAFAVIVVSAGCILRQAWARPVLRVLSLGLAVWAAYRAVVAWYQWHMLTVIAPVLVAAGHSTPEQAAEAQHMQHLLLISAGVGVVATVVLLWLAWQLGQPAVRLQFRSRSF